MAEPKLIEGFDLVLVLGGGNALGAYHMGVCDVLLAREEPAWIVGCSIGAATGAILLGNPPEARMERLHEFWQTIRLPDGPFAQVLPPAVRARWSNGVGLQALFAGRTGVSRPRFPGWLSLLPWMPSDVSLQDHRPLGALVDRLVDWDRLNGSPVRFSLFAIDVERGAETWWDNRRDRIDARHILAATALPPLMPPVDIDGRLFWDGGLGNNLPLDRALSGPLERPRLVVASDLYAPEGGRPRSLDDTALRAQDLGFSLHATKRIEALDIERTLRRRADPTSPPAVLAHLVHRPLGHQRALKALDFSGTAIEERAAQGRAAMREIFGLLPGVPRDEALARLTVPAA